MSDDDQPPGSDANPRSAPRQGFANEGNGASGPVKPPGAAELVASAGELVGDLAKAALSASDRLLKRALSHLPRP